jgi:hypothetical protein
VTAQNDLSHHPPLAPPDVSMSYWTALPMEPTDMYYPTCYDNSQDLSLAHCHTATGDHFQYGQHGACGGVCGGTTSYDTSSSIYSESDTPLVTSPPTPTLPAPAPHPTTTRDQTASEHSLIQWDSLIVTRSALYEVSTLPHLLGNDTGSQGLVLGKCRRRHHHHHRDIPGHRTKL